MKIMQVHISTLAEMYEHEHEHEKDNGVSGFLSALSTMGQSIMDLTFLDFQKASETTAAKIIKSKAQKLVTCME